MARAKAILAGLLALVGVAVTAAPAEAASYVVYIHGRSMGSWTKTSGAYTNTVSKTGWTPVYLEFDGSAGVNDADVHNVVKNAVSSSCSGGNSCVLMCYSTGCLRMLRAVKELGGVSVLPGLSFAMGMGSAAGGTQLAEISTQGLTGLLAKIFGQQEKADYDLTRAAANDTWGFVQDVMSPKTLYHVGGYKDTCVNLLVLKICGGSFINGVDDGVVGLDSASGAAKLAGSNPYPGTSDACNVMKYAGRAWDYGSTNCGGLNANHAEIPKYGAERTALRMTSATSATKLFSWGNTTGTLCDRTLPGGQSGSCDQAYAGGTSTDFASVTGAAAVEHAASNTFGTTAQGSCAGRCGGSAGTCACDLYAHNTGQNYCGDTAYTAANCDGFNNQRRAVFRAKKSATEYRAYIDLAAAKAYAGANPIAVPFYVQPTDQGGMQRLLRCNVSGVERLYTRLFDDVCPAGTLIERLGWVAVSAAGAYRESKVIREWKHGTSGLYFYTLDVNENPGSGWTLQSGTGAYAWTN